MIYEHIFEYILRKTRHSTLKIATSTSSLESVLKLIFKYEQHYFLSNNNIFSASVNIRKRHQLISSPGTKFHTTNNSLSRFLAKELITPSLLNWISFADFCFCSG
mmetsp:Transcript_4408/g.6758  ORF Transcript_4408/g.6758 Transcript_4408/m.6758 type:complete len:105 (+) Transcript_4408:637-951(+)